MRKKFADIKPGEVFVITNLLNGDTSCFARTNDARLCINLQTFILSSPIKDDAMSLEVKPYPAQYYMKLGGFSGKRPKAA